MLMLTLAVVSRQLMGYQMLFYLEIWPNIPLDFHNPLLLELLVKQCKDNILSGSQHLYDLQPGTQQ